MTHLPLLHAARGAARALAGLAFAVLCAPALACPYCIRDAGFVVREPDPYLLAVFESDRHPVSDGAKAAFESAMDTYLPYSNLEVRVFNVARIGNSHEAERARPFIPDSTPSAVLISPLGAALKVSGGFSSRARAMGFLRGMVDSPVRDACLQHLVTDWCVTIVEEGADAEENDRLARAVSAAGESLVGLRTEMGARIDNPPHIVTYPYRDRSEATFRWSVGLGPDEDGNVSREARVVVLFGIGRRIGPVQSSSDITERSLRNLYLLLGRNCTCTSDPSWLLGPAAPMLWTVEDQERVRDALGFDPNNPMVMSTLSGVWPAVGQGRGWRSSAPAGYSEFVIE